MRDKLKDRAYYDSFISLQRERIKKKTAKLNESDGDKRQRVLLSLTGYETDLLKAEFSAGAAKEDLKILLLHAMNIVCEYNNMTYDDLLTFLSLAVILDAEKDAEPLIEANRYKIDNDRLLSYISTYIEKKSQVWNLIIPLRKEYEPLNLVFSGTDKETAIKEYLAQWYDAHSEYSWYNSHLRDTDTYCGYWSFESAAVAKIAGVCTDTISIMPYYPSL